MNDYHRRLKNVAQTLSLITSGHPHIIALKGWAIGATYAVIKAVEFDFYERMTWVEHANEYEEVACLLSEDKELKSKTAISWLAGFYFNSALLRIASMDEKTMNAFNGTGIISNRIRKQYNKIKHEISGAMYIRLKGHGITFEELIHTLEELSSQLVKNYNNYKAPINQER